MVFTDLRKKTRSVEYYYPQIIRTQNMLLYCKSRIPFTKEITTVYETIETYEKIFFPHIQTRVIKIPQKRISLREPINIHDEDGIKDTIQITNFTEMIKKGKNIINASGLPNIKLARLHSKDLLVFDGHHSLLAYLAAGKVFLDEIPHIIVFGEKGYLTDEEILVFWGSHAREISGKNWKSYVINWQKPKKQQIASRRQHNMGELYDRIRERISGFPH